MNLKKTTLALVALIIALPLLSGCGGRQPTVKKSETLLLKHFNQYAKKYPTSVFGQYKVDQVAILDTEEIHKHYVHITADVSLNGYKSERIRAALEKKLPLGWKLVAWERLNDAMANPTE